MKNKLFKFYTMAIALSSPYLLNIFIAMWILVILIDHLVILEVQEIFTFSSVLNITDNLHPKNLSLIILPGLTASLNLDIPLHVASYDNLDNSENLSNIRQKYKDKGVIYGIQNKIDHKLYVGSTTNSFDRFKDHLLRKKSKHSNIKLRRAIAKYKLSNFRLIIFSVTEFQDNLNANQKKHIILPLEQKYIDMFNKTQIYNILPSAGSNLGYKHKTETKIRISNSVKLSAPTRNKYDRTEDHQYKLLKSNKKELYVYDAQTLLLINGKPFSSKKNAVEELKIYLTTINKLLDTFKPFMKNYITLYFFSKELTQQQILELRSKKADYKGSANQVVWVYTKDINGKLIPYNSNEPTFNSVREAWKNLKVDQETIRRKLKADSKQTHIKGFYFFKFKQESII